MPPKRKSTTGDYNIEYVDRQMGRLTGADNPNEGISNWRSGVIFQSNKDLRVKPIRELTTTTTTTSPNTQKLRKKRQNRISKKDMVDDVNLKLARQDSAHTRLKKDIKEKKKTRKAATKIQKAYRGHIKKKEQIKRENLRGAHYEIEYDNDDKAQYIQMSPQFIPETGELLQIPMPAQNRKSRNEEARLLFEKVDKELSGGGKRTRKRRRRKRKTRRKRRRTRRKSRRKRRRRKRRTRK
jgi:hypothetical protein